MTLHLFEAFGIELEYMIVDRHTLAPLPMADRLLAHYAGKIVEDVEFGEVALSNELALHVIEMKGQGPKSDLVALAKNVHETVVRVNRDLEQWNAMLLGTAMHPTLNPDRDTKLWPHGNREIYAAYDRIFDCRGHGWSNLQSVHINLPFHGDEEFGRLHAAVRAVLPLIPSLSASSPIADGEIKGVPDFRLNVYRNNQRKVPSITGLVVPEACFTKADYEREIFQTMYRDIKPLDPQGLLQHEWLNSRGAIARWDRDAIEIRVVDIQECPRADFAVIALIVGLVKALAEERFCSMAELRLLKTQHLAKVLFDHLDGQSIVLQDPHLAKVLGLSVTTPLSDVWRLLLPRLEIPIDLRPDVDQLLHLGSLSRRIISAVEKSSVTEVYHQLGNSLRSNHFFSQQPS